MDAEPSSVYVTLAAMIEKDGPVQSYSEFARSLEALENSQRITRDEHKSLLEMFRQKLGYRDDPLFRP